ncbi:MAG: hypothetical protein QF464_04580 [Myxococcota bacterium]|jgi:hypothetical protein|nr:hypothetical protein [Myxococcota bacterium]
MREPRTHERALRAALQVARGNRKQAASVVTGVAMLTGCSSDAGEGDHHIAGDATTQDSASTTAEDAVQALLDAMDAAAAGDAATAPQPDADPIADASGQTGDDATTLEVWDAAAGHSGDDAASQAGEDTAATADCIDSCWQPTETACTTHTDCNMPEVPGACATTGETCNYSDMLCPDEQACEGYEPPKEVYVDPETGEPDEYNSGLECIDGMCHEGDQFSAAAQACCGFDPIEPLPWCEGIGAPIPGCTPWGPPAPPAFDGTTLAERMRRWRS